MCIIAVCEDRFLTKEEIDNCFKQNSDGAGFSWREDGKNHYIKGIMSINKFHRLYEEFKEKKILPHVVHFRTATTGGVVNDLTHPFIVSKDSPVSKLSWSGEDSLLFHNGVVSGWQKDLLKFYMGLAKKIPAGNWSDSRFMAILVHYLGRHALKFEGSKYALMDNENIWTYGHFLKDSGVHFSNEGYKGGSIYRGGWGYYYGNEYWDRDDEQNYKMVTTKANRRTNIKQKN